MSDHARMPMTVLMRGGGRLSAPRGASRGGSSKADERGTDQPVAKPFVKWAGGKGKLAPKIRDIVGTIKFNNYWEPFVGGGAVFFHLHDGIAGKVNLSDINDKLITTYKVIKKSEKGIISILEYHKKQHKRYGKKHYEKVRKNFWKSEDEIENAAGLIYLNKTCYNGLYRVNRSDGFNVPMGNYKNPNICDKENIAAVSDALSGVYIRHKRFDRIEPKRGDLVYCDPPYDNTFTGYTKDGFDENDQKLLRDKCNEWRNNGVHVIISNSKTERIEDLYPGGEFEHHPTEAARYINCDGSGRGKITELIIVGRAIK